MGKPTYIDVMNVLAQYASDNLNMALWQSDKVVKVLHDVQASNDDAIEKLAGMRCKKDLGGDELDAIELIMHLEEEFDIQIDDGWVGGKGDDPTMGEFAEYVSNL